MTEKLIPDTQVQIPPLIPSSFENITYPKGTTGNDYAQSEVLITGNNAEFEGRAAANRQGKGAFTAEGADMVGNEVFKLLRRQQEAQLITDNIGLETFHDVGTDKQLERLQFGLTKLDYQKATQREIAIVSTFLNGGANYPSAVIDQIDRQATFGEIEGFREFQRQNRLDDLRFARDAYVAGQGLGDTWEAVLDISVQELTPIYNVMSKMAINRAMLRGAKVPTEDQPHFLIGEARLKVREALVAMPSDAARLQAVNDIVKEVEKLQDHPVYGGMIMQFGILEAFEATLTEDALSGATSKDSWDRFFGNFESAAEGLFSIFALARGGKTIKGVFSATDANTNARLARETANRRFQTRVEEVLAQNVAREFGIDPAEAAVGRLARPSEFLDDRTVHLPGVARANEKLDRLEGKIMEASAGRLTAALTRGDKDRVIRTELEKLDLGDHAVAAPAMSTIEEGLDGVLIKQVIAKNGESGWNSFDELLPDLLALDPRLEQLSILRRNAQGRLEAVPTSAEELARIATMRPQGLSDADLIARSGATDNAIEFSLLEREAARRAGDVRTVDELLGDEFFLEWDHFRAYHPTDKVAFGDQAIRNTSIPFSLLTPNAKFGDEIVGAFQENYLGQERIGRLFENMYAPFYKLGQADKKVVAQVYEWSEDFGKEFGDSPSMYDVLAQFPEMTQKQQLGMLALRRGMDTQYEVFNRRLFLEWNGLGYKTATSIDPSLPRYHGKALDQAEVKTGGTFYDPVTQEAITMDAAGLESVYNQGGRILELDVPIDIPGFNGTKQAKRIVVDGVDYRMGNLSRNPLEYYPGYSYRFYDDPYYIVKRQNGVEVDGVVRSGTDRTEDAIKTAGSKLEAEQFLGRMARRQGAEEVWVDEEGIEYAISRSKDLAQTDQVFKQKQALQREGRLFWDNRNRDRLADVNGNQSELMDFVKSLERGTRLSARVNQEEDLMRTLKEAFNGEYADLLNEGDFAKLPAKTLIENLSAQLANAAGDAAKTRRIKGAIGVAKYLRQMDGVDAVAIPRMRAEVLKLAIATDRWLNGWGLKPGKLGYLEKKIATADPIRTSRSAAFHAFMVFRPARQALLQMAQPLFLAGIDPLYVVSGKGLTDSIALRAGFWRYVDSGADAGYSNKALAKMMGLKKAEFQRLLEKFEESGALDVVDVHAFAGGTNRFNKTALSKGDGPLATFGYGARVTGNATIGAFKKFGFDFGEGMNKVGTYNVAWRRVMRDKKYNSLLDMTDEDWRKVKMDTENLSLSMSRPNNAAYQSGLLSVTTQFLAFTHKVTLAAMFQNPALKNGDVVKLWASGLTLFGANMFGARDYVRESLTGIGFQDILDEELPGSPGTTVVDLLSAGLIQTVTNKIMNTPIDTESFTPVLNIKQFFEMTVEGILANPAQGMLGPFGNRASAFLDALEFSRKMTMETDLPPADKFTFVADMMMSGVFPQYNDVTMAWHGYHQERLYHLSGESLDIQPTWEAMVARGLFGARTMQEMAWYRMEDKFRDSDAIVKDMIFSNRRFLKQYMFLYRDGQIDRDTFHDVARIVGMMAENAPDGRKEEVIKGSFLTHYADDDPADMPINALWEGVKNQRLTAAQAKDSVNQLITDPVERARLHQWIDDVFDERIVEQEEQRKRMIEHNPNLRD